MIFTEARFLWFFLAVFGVFWSLRREGLRKLWLLACSYAFYAAWDWRFLSLIVASTAIDYGCGRALAREPRSGRRRAWLVVSLAVNLGLLGVFKYHDFFVTEAAALLAWMGLPWEPRLLDVILPAGISFYTFQTLSYTIDVHGRRLEPSERPLDFALFVGFFPQLVAGPIVRAIDFLPQLRSPRRWADVAVRAQLTLFLLGFIKKAVVSDGVAPMVEAVFADPSAWGLSAKWLATCLYTVQIYCDFSGYSDMAIASAGLLGYTLTLNFDFPYLARSITEFWRRWHISLSTWFRDYLYIPLGGNRGGPTRTYVNLALVFLLCGLWHGARWTFVLWGLYHGAFLVAERLGAGRLLARLPKACGHVYALLVTFGGWVLFRADSVPAALDVLAGMLPGTAAAQGATPPHAGLWWLGVALFAVCHVAQSRRLAERLGERLSAPAYALALGVVSGLVLPWVATDFQPFIYFQF